MELIKGQRMVGEILILAAGSSRRMRGKDKLVEPVDGLPQLRRIADRAVQTGWPVRITLPENARARVQALAGTTATIVAVSDHAQGMSASLRAGYAAYARARARGGLMILPADMPELETDDLSALIEAHRGAPDAIHCGASGDRRGHPVILPHWMLPQLAHLTGDQGAKRLIEAQPEKLRYTQLAGQRAILDLDTPEAWEAWRSNRLD
jgi:CTP:molybdopterin cytidylyltransferase MocA